MRRVYSSRNASVTPYRYNPREKYCEATYDAAGIRVKTVHPGGKTSYFPFPGYEEEVNGSTTTRRITYAIAGQTVALRVQVVGGSNTLYYLHSDHLGSTSLAATTSGAVVAARTARHLPFGG
jgi:hypothetical protein